MGAEITASLAAPFPWFGGKSRAAPVVWGALGRVLNYVEPFAGSAAMLLAAPDGNRIETINDADGFVANFWRAVTHDADAVADAADWPCNEVDLEARHSWLVRHADGLKSQLSADPDFYDARIAGWWCWGQCNWIGSGWCSGNGPWVHDGSRIVDSRQLPHLSAGQGINRQLPHLGDAGKGINRQLPHLGDAGKGSARRAFILDWMRDLQARLRDVRVTCGDWSRIVKDSVTIRHGLTGVFLDPPYTLGNMDYSAGGAGGALASDVRDWCRENGGNPLLRIVLCGHAGEHDYLLSAGWTIRTWKPRKGYAITGDAVARAESETIWCSPACIEKHQGGLFDAA